MVLKIHVNINLYYILQLHMMHVSIIIIVTKILFIGGRIVHTINQFS